MKKAIDMLWVFALVAVLTMFIYAARDFLEAKKVNDMILEYSRKYNNTAIKNAGRNYYEDLEQKGRGVIIERGKIESFSFEGGL